MHNNKVLLLIAVLLVITFIFYDSISRVEKPASVSTMVNVTNTPIPTGIQIKKPSLAGNYKLGETSDENTSSSQIWWLNSGAYFYLNNGVGKTIQGDLPASDPWAIKYLHSNPTETDNGTHPQNIFRLVSKSKWNDFQQSVYFKINRYILSPDSHRTASNGVLFFNRYQDGNNLYYTGMRVDGYAVIKKKIDGNYYTMTIQPVITNLKYDRDQNPNLLKVNSWMGIKSEIKNLDNNKVSIKLYFDSGRTGEWVMVAEAVDDNKSYGGESITKEGFVGIRTDFMDAEFEDYKIE